MNHLCLSNSFFPSGFPSKNIICISELMHTTWLTYLILDLNILIDIWWRIQTMKLLIMQFSPSAYHCVGVEDLEFIVVPHPLCSSDLVPYSFQLPSKHRSEVCNESDKRN
jgi:hypothetical protein